MHLRNTVKLNLINYGTQNTILLVEDEFLIAAMQTKQLEAEGYHVIHTVSGENAIDIINIRTESVDLILMDIHLGNGMDGTEAAEFILKNHDIPIVFLSSQKLQTIVEKAKKISPYGYVMKNVDNTILIAAIKSAFKLFVEHQNKRRLQ